MGTEYFARLTEDFFTGLDRAGQQLKNFAGETDTRRDKVFEELKGFAQSCSKEKTAYADSKNEIEKAVGAVIEEVGEAVAAWQDKLVSSKKGTAFMHKHEKHLVVMVFGAVKAGKSSLGNFFAGREFRKAAFDNAYKKRPFTVFETEETKRDYGGIVADKEGHSWFAEGFVDTTGSMQYFTMSGLRWLDSPGTGAVVKAGENQDGRTMEDMVKEYIPYTDLCIFLMNSSEPGLQEDMKYIKLLEKENQTALVLITKSDINDEDIDEQGNLIARIVPKTPKVRTQQESFICQQIKEACPEVAEDKYQALSISTWLAKEALKDGDEEKMRGSQIDKLMQLIREKTAENIIALKERRPKESFNLFVDSIIGDEETESIAGLEKQLTDILGNIRGKQQEIEEKKKSTIKYLKSTAINKAFSDLRKMARQVGQNKAISDKDISDKLQEVISPLLQKEINDAVKKLIKGYREQRMQTLKLDLKAGGLHKEEETIEQEYTVSTYVSRSPEGIWENIRSFFGKTYYTLVTERRTHTQKVDLGTNIDSYLEKIRPVMEKEFTAYINSSFDMIKTSYFQPQEEYLSKLQKELKQLKEKLRGLKYEI